MAHPRLGDLLESNGVITHEQLQHALEQQKVTKKRLGEELIDEGVITEQQFIDTLRIQLGIDFIDLSVTTPDPQLAAILPRNLTKKYDVTPVRLHGDTLYLAMADPLNFMAQEEVKAATRRRVVPMIATKDAILHANASLYGNEGASRAIEDMKREIVSGPQSMPAVDNVLDLGENTAPTVRLVNSIIERAVLEGASDIHLDPTEAELRVRMRIDGVMCFIMNVPKDLQASVLARLKIMGGMDITERRVPQDGRTGIVIHQHGLDLRMSTIPTIYGEKVVIRLLDKNSQLLTKEHIGLTGADLGKYQSLLRRPNGVILLAGPTGSGKSSTMYTMIREVNTPEVNLMTLEDPVEYNIDGVNQTQINEKTGMTFANGLRSILRQDPDIIAVGEIRDGETAEIAMRAAITGHRVFSTIHTNSALAAIDRLRNIGVPDYLIAGALNGVISQRLVRRVCPECKETYAPDPEDLADVGLSAKEGQTFSRGKGCPNCFGTGYRGRIAVFEILVLSKRLRAAISRGAQQDELERIAEEDGNFVRLDENCRRLLKEGVTSIEEIRHIMVSAQAD